MGKLVLKSRHRLICGDSTDAAAVGRLMDGERAGLCLSDPPYGINIVGRSGTAGNFPGTNAPRLQAVPIVGDDKPFDPTHLLHISDRIILWGGNYYADKLPAMSKWLVWDKKDGAFQGSDLGDCELAWSNLGGAARLLHHTWQGMYRKGEGERSKRIHPTQKPVGLMAWCIEQSGVGQGDIVIDCYAGSLSTLIASHKTGHRCFACEVAPAYVDAGLLRYIALTGEQPILESTGETFEQVKARRPQVPEETTPIDTEAEQIETEVEVEA